MIDFKILSIADKFLIFKLGTEDGIKIGLNEKNNTGSLIGSSERSRDWIFCVLLDRISLGREYGTALSSSDGSIDEFRLGFNEWN